MNGKTLGVLWVLLAITAFAEGQQTEAKVDESSKLPANTVVKILKTQYDATLVRILVNGFPPQQLQLTSEDRDSGFFTVAGTPEAIGQLEEVIRKYDKPAKNVELTFYLVEGTELEEQPPLPKALESVVAELRRALVYKSYRLVYPVTMRVRDGRSATSSGSLPLTSAPSEDPNLTPQPGGYQVSAEHVTVQGEPGHYLIAIGELSVRLGGEERMIQTPMGGNTGASRIDRVRGPQSDIQTSVDVRENDTVVVGKASVDTRDRAMFVALVARVVD